MKFIELTRNTKENCHKIHCNPEKIASLERIDNPLDGDSPCTLLTVSDKIWFYVRESPGEIKELIEREE